MAGPKIRVSGSIPVAEWTYASQHGLDWGDLLTKAIQSIMAKDKEAQLERYERWYEAHPEYASLTLAERWTKFTEGR